MAEESRLFLELFTDDSPIDIGLIEPFGLVTLRTIIYMQNARTYESDAEMTPSKAIYRRISTHNSQR